MAEQEEYVGKYAVGQLIAAIHQVNEFFLRQTQRQENRALTLRNWIIGHYIVEYEQKRQDRAAYGQKLYKTIADKLKAIGLKSLGEHILYLGKDFYLAYPQILQTVSAKSNRLPKKEGLPRADPKQLLGTLSFSHFIELLKADSPLKRFLRNSGHQKRLVCTGTARGNQ